VFAFVFELPISRTQYHLARSPGIHYDPEAAELAAAAGLERDLAVDNMTYALFHPQPNTLAGFDPPSPSWCEEGDTDASDADVVILRGPPCALDHDD